MIFCGCDSNLLPTSCLLVPSLIRRSRGTKQWKEAKEKQKETSFYHWQLHEVFIKHIKLGSEHRCNAIRVSIGY